VGGCFGKPKKKKSQRGRYDGSLRVHRIGWQVRAQTKGKSSLSESSGLLRDWCGGKVSWGPGVVGEVKPADNAMARDVGRQTKNGKAAGGHIGGAAESILIGKRCGWQS